MKTAAKIQMLMTLLEDGLLTPEEIEELLSDMGWGDDGPGYCRHEWKEQILFSSTEVKCCKCGMDKDKYLEAIAKHKR